jgi:thiol-disulfide isomerase/thioredoxin
MDTLTVSNIKGFLKDNSKAIVLFYASWCPYCSRFLEVVDKDKKLLKHKLAYAMIDDDDNEFWVKYDIGHVPTLIAFSNGKIAARKDAEPGVGLKEEDLLDADRALGA